MSDKSEYVEVTHPLTGNKVIVTREIAETMQAMLDQLRRDNEADEQTGSESQDDPPAS